MRAALRPIPFRCLCACSLCCLLSALSHANVPDNNLRSADVFIKAQSAFAQQHALAPRAQLRYRVLAQGQLTLTQTIGGAKNRVPLDERSSFSWPAPVAGQSLQAATKSGQAALWRPDIRSPDLPDGARRLGDLRLECVVDAQSGLNPASENSHCQPGARKPDCLNEMESCLREASLRLKKQVEQLGQLEIEPSPYQNRPPHYLFVADQPLFSITLRHGDKHLLLPAVWQYGSAITTSPFASWPYPREYLYSLPLESADWPDDTLVLFEPLEKP
ncbi:hypothetical protein [Chromobacterium sp. IIBBL 290-4]|uniref:hypothetical protein n=1 Tax=Chromobacterium sp. IIBBL 290-4 TaxID=2953890 RepID=UPI0020B6E263|nr:hypothetical protein [Chromobacterium sp. IIBBL 290-4]UTH76346.1 hypothetical protein NKT35_09675 [Chromobacterium sp. IIBBL 290-4]